MTVASHMAHLFGLPRRYAIGINGRWSRRHIDVVSIDHLHGLLSNQSLCFALRGSTSDVLKDLYTEYHHFIIFDIDADENIEGAKKCALEISGILSKLEGVNHLITFSGKKGFHIWIFLSEEMHYEIVARWQKSLLESLGYIQTEYDKFVKGNINVETLITRGQNAGKIIKVPFSQHQNREGFYEIPITQDDIQNFNKDATPTPEQWAKGIDLFLATKQTDFLIILLGAPDITAQPTMPIRHYRRSHAPDMRYWDIPETAERAPQMLEIIKEIPCLYKCYKDSKENHGIYWLRAVLVVAFAQMGYTRQEIAVFFRDYINDDDDNSHTQMYHTLQYQINYWYEKYQLCNCDVLRVKEGRFKCCDTKCARSNPARPEEPLKIEIPPIDGRDAKTVFDEIYNSRESTYQVYGTMRSRKTTEAVLGAIRHRRKAVVVVPRISIMEQTGIDILGRAKENGMEAYSCMILDNRRLCLRLAEKIDLIRKQWNVTGDEKTAFEELRRVEKPSCADCPYKFNFIPEEKIEPNKLYGESDIENKYCGYQTIAQYSHLWNVIWISDSKFVAVADAQGTTFTTPLMEQIANVDVYILDEVSHFIENPSLDVEVLRIEQDGHEYSFVDVINNEISGIAHDAAHDIPDMFDSEEAASRNRELKRLNDLTSTTKTFVTEMQKRIDEINGREDFKSELYQRDIDSEEIERLKKIGAHILRSVMVKAEYANVAYNAVIDMLDLNIELEWIFSNVPDEITPTALSVKIAPKTSHYISILQAERAMVIALDATPPAIPLDAVLGKYVKKVNIGDPSKTNDLFIIVPDTIHTSASDLPKDMDRLANWIEWTAKVFGEDKIGMLTASIERHRCITDRIAASYPHIDTLYHRGRRVIGVAYDKRIGVSVCAPLAPKNVSHWLKEVYKDVLANVSSYQLWRHEQARQTQQAEARFKDPLSIERSGILSFGQTPRSIEASYANAIVKPRVLHTIEQYGGSTNEVPIQVVQLALWKYFSVVAETRGELRALLGIIRGKTNEEINNVDVKTINCYRELLSLLPLEIAPPGAGNHSACTGASPLPCPSS